MEPCSRQRDVSQGPRTRRIRMPLDEIRREKSTVSFAFCLIFAVSLLFLHCQGITSATLLKMTTYNTTWKNKAWLGWFLLQIPLILRKSAGCVWGIPDSSPRLTARISTVIDLLEFLWPKWVYEPAGAPLHFIFALKEWYIQTYNDPIVQWTVETAAGHDSWMGLFLRVEFVFLLPTVLYAVYRLGVQHRGTSGADELLFMVYALEVAFTTLVCIYDSFYWDDAVYSAELKRTFLVQFYGPWCLIRKCLSGVAAIGSSLTVHKHPSGLLTWQPGFSAASGQPMRLWKARSCGNGDPVADCRGRRQGARGNAMAQYPCDSVGHGIRLICNAPGHLTRPVNSKRRGIFLHAKSLQWFRNRNPAFCSKPRPRGSP